MSISRTLTKPRRVRRVYGPSTALRVALTPLAPVVEAEEEVETYEAATIIDDFAGEALSLSGLSGPTTVQGGICLARTGEITSASTPTPVLTANAGASGLLLWSDGADGYAVGVGYVEWECAALLDLTQGGESNALRIKITDMDINTGDPLLNIEIEDNDSNSVDAEIGLSTDLPADLTAWGVGYVDFLLANFTAGGVDVEDVKRVRLTIKSEVDFIFGGEALIQIDEIRRACSGLTTNPGGISSDDSGGPLECPALLLIDDFTGDSLHVDDTTPGPVSGSNSGGLCGTRKMENYFASYGMEGDINESSDGVLRYHDGSDGQTDGYLYVQWGDYASESCGKIDITGGGKYNAARITITGLSIASGVTATQINFFCKDQYATTFTESAYARVCETSFGSHGIAYLDFVFPSSALVKTDVTEIQLDFKNSGFSPLTYIKIDRIDFVCSALSATGNSTDGSGGPNDGTCP